MCQNEKIKLKSSVVSSLRVSNSMSVTMRQTTDSDTPIQAVQYKYIYIFFFKLKSVVIYFSSARVAKFLCIKLPE